MAVKSSAILTLIRIDDGEDASIRSATAPSDHTKLWFDTTTQKDMTVQVVLGRLLTIMLMI